MSSRKTAIFKLIPSQEHPFEATSMTDLASCCTPGLTRFVRDFCDCLMSGTWKRVVRNVNFKFHKLLVEGNEEKPEICGSLIASLPIKWLSFTGLIYMSVKYPEDKQVRGYLRWLEYAVVYSWKFCSFQTRDTFYYKCCVSKVDPSCFFESLKSNGIIPG